MRRICIIVLIMMIPFCLYSQDSLKNKSDIIEFIKVKTNQYIDSLKKVERITDDSKTIYVINIAELDVKKNTCSFSLGYILNNIEIDKVQASNYMNLGDRIIMVKSKLIKDKLTNELNFPVMTDRVKEILFQIVLYDYFPDKAMLLFSNTLSLHPKTMDELYANFFIYRKKLMLNINYHPFFYIISLNKGEENIKFIGNEWILPEKYSIVEHDPNIYKNIDVKVIHFDSLIDINYDSIDYYDWKPYKFDSLNKKK